MAIIKKNRKVILVDVGSTNEKLASNTLNNFLKAKAIKKIDLVLLTHMHEDHMNGIYNIDAKIERIGYSIPSEITEEYLKLEEYIRQNNISKLELKKGDEINFKNINIQILLPYNNKNIKADDIINANSMVILIKISENKKLVKEYSRNFLFMGDSTNETENELLKEYDIDIFKNIDVLQIGHHGSKTSSSEEFIRIINTKLALISCKKEVYAHPAKETLDKLEKYNIRYHITQNSGALKINI